MKKIKELYVKYKEIILYLFFGVVTTVVSLAACFVTLKVGVLFEALRDEAGEPTELLDVLGSTVQWVSGVLVAFFTNKKWVFTDAEKSSSTLRQLCVFASGRVVTFFIDYGVTLFGAIALAAVLPALNSVSILGKELNVNEIAAKIVAAVIVIISNYIFSKLFVFKKKKNTSENQNNAK